MKAEACKLWRQRVRDKKFSD